MMLRYIALLRAVNVGGTGKLLMADLKALCVEAGFDDVETYIASGNVVFSSKAHSDDVLSQLEQCLQQHAGKPIGVLLRTAREMQAVLAANPFSTQAPNLTYSFFLPDKPPKDTIGNTRLRKDEGIQLGKREIYVYYPAGMGRSRLQIPAAAGGTARNMNTVARLTAMAGRA
jgi:uncharacterized protein (DUF1697 family)